MSEPLNLREQQAHDRFWPHLAHCSYRAYLGCDSQCWQKMVRRNAGRAASPVAALPEERDPT